MARSFAKPGDGSGGGGEDWYNSTAYPGWIWKGSSHLVVYPSYRGSIFNNCIKRQ